MATVIDALLITLNLDPSGFKKGTKETDEALKKTSAASTKTSKDMESWGKNAAGSLSKLRNEALGLLAVFTAGVGINSFIADKFKQAASLGRLSENLNMSAKDLSMWQLANKNAGGSVEGMTAQLEAANHAIAAYKAGNADSGTTQAFFYGHLTDADMKDVPTYMAALSRTIAQFKGDAAKQSFVANEIGVNKDTFNLMKQTTDEVERQRQKFSTLAEQMAQAAGPAEEMRKKIDGLGDSFSASGMKILGKFVPAMEAALEVLKNVADALNDDEFMGEATARIFAFFGNKEAQEALNANKKDYSAFAPATLNLGEDEELARRRKMAPTTNGGVKDGSQDSWDDDAPKKQNASTVSPALFSKLEKQYGLDDGLLDSMWQQESGRGKNMRSKAGAKGHFQFMDATAKQYGLTDPDDLAQSADAAARMMRDLKKQNGGSLPKALAAYNWGQGNLDKKGIDAAPTETKNYAPQVQARMAANKTVPNMGNAANVANMVQAARPQARAGNSTSTSSSETNINGPITINTQATDAKGIARDLGKVIASSSLASQANTGLA